MRTQALYFNRDLYPDFFVHLLPAVVCSFLALTRQIEFGKMNIHVGVTTG